MNETPSLAIDVVVESWGCHYFDIGVEYSSTFSIFSFFSFFRFFASVATY